MSRTMLHEDIGQRLCKVDDALVLSSNQLERQMLSNPKKVGFVKLTTHFFFTDHRCWQCNTHNQTFRRFVLHCTTVT